jgi:iron complex transport system ATP-binding protein
VILEIEHVSVALEGTTVLEDVSASVDEGGWLGVVGPNGAGKTTLLRAVAGLVGYEGAIRVAGRVPDLARRREVARLVSFVPQRPVIPAAMSVTDYIMLGRSAHHSYLGAPTRRDRRVVAAVLERLELTMFAGRPLARISGGECQRVVLARALAQEAPVLVLDEPTASLDLGHGQLVLELADELRRERSLCVLCALHDLTFAAQYSDRLLVLAGGRQVACGSAAEVLTQDSVEAIFEASVEVLDGRSGIAVTPVRPGHRAVAAPPLRRLQA